MSKTTFFKIKGNEAYNNMLANTLTLHTPLTPGDGVKKSICFFFESSHVKYQINRNEA